MHLILVGLMGSGKSTVAEALAARRGWRAMDLDVAIEQETSRSVEQLFAERGEEGFRSVESRVLARLLDTPGPWVLACGGGTVLAEENRRAMRAAGPVIWLDASSEELARRVIDDTSRVRPLLAGVLRAAGGAGAATGEEGGAPRSAEGAAGMLARLRHARQEQYAATADLVIQTGGLTVAEVVDRLEGWLSRPAPRQPGAERPAPRPESRRTTLPVLLEGGRSYEVTIEEGGLDGFGDAFAAAFPSAASTLIISDRTVAGLYAEELQQILGRQDVAAALFVLEPGESSKRMETVAAIWEKLAGLGADRGTPVVALGGGVVSDVAGFAAATWLRGIPWACVPTTLLAQIDASIGGKTGVNHPAGKNLIGVFHQPRLVFSSLATLRTLPVRELRAGLAEAVKAALVGSPELFALCEREAAKLLEGSGPALAEVVRRAVEVKAALVIADEREAGPRRKLNLGHTLGHALEAASQQGDRQPLLHGEAVAIGMAAAARIAVALGRLQPEVAERIAALLAQLGLPVELPDWMEPGQEGELRSWLAVDKKRRDADLALQIPEAIGSVGEAFLAVEEILARLGRTRGGAP